MKEKTTIIERGAQRLSGIKEFFLKKNKDKGYYSRALVKLTERYLTWRNRRKFVQQQAQQNGPLKGWGAAFIWAMCVVLLVNQYLLQAYVVPSGSMRNTLMEGDRLFVNKVVYGPELLPGVGKLTFRTRPERGDVIIFENPNYLSRGPAFDIMQRIIYMVTLSMVDIDRGNQNHFFVKRAVGADGDVVKVENGNCYFKPAGEENFYLEADYKNLRGLEYANKKLIPTTYYTTGLSDMSYSFYENIEKMEIPEDIIQEASVFRTDHPKIQNAIHDPFFLNKKGSLYTYMIDPSNRMAAEGWWNLEKGQYVPVGSILPLGDNRDNSHDGRFFGTITKDDILGRALIKYWPLPRFGLVK